MEMSGFNLSTKKEDVSTRLKSQNIKRAKQETKKLEIESKKMEERLLELKLAMEREKEERERQGGGFWKAGQTGSLTTYATDVLQKSAKSSKGSKGKMKILVLKDKPLDIPERNSQPGTMAFIAQKGLLTPRDKPKGAKCGQCEERPAAVSCLQCTEDYCAGCFASFHLKGALKKHRSVPISATGPRQCFASPRPTPPHTGRKPEQLSADGATSPYTPNITYKQIDRNGPDGASGSFDGNDPLQEVYNEEESAASFQEALQAWRGEKTKMAAGNIDFQSPRVVYSPVRTPVVNMDSATTTTETDAPEIEVKFNTHSLSYAEKLMLKKHRRMDLESLSTPRVSDMEIVDIEDGDEQFDEEDRVSFQAIYDAVVSSNLPSVTKNKDDQKIFVEEISGSLSQHNVDQATAYTVEEVSDIQSWEIDARTEMSLSKSKARNNSPVLANSPTPPSAKRPSAGKKRRQESANQLSASVKTVTDIDKASISFTNHIISNNDVEKTNYGAANVKPEVEKQTLSSTKSKPHSAKFLPEPDEPVTEEQSDSSKMSKPKSAKFRPESGKSRPQTGKRANSQQSGHSRPSSSASSRAVSRISKESLGILTKAPSSALQEVARIPITGHAYHSGNLEDFFMAGGVKSYPQDRVMTPSSTRSMSSQSSSKVKVSYQLYSMAPKSWKPDWSTTENVPMETIDNEVAQEERSNSVMACHAMSEQIVSNMTEDLVQRIVNTYGENFGRDLFTNEDRPWSAEQSNDESRPSTVRSSRLSDGSLSARFSIQDPESRLSHRNLASARDVHSRQTDREIPSRLSTIDVPPKQYAVNVSVRQSTKIKDIPSRQSTRDIPSKQSARDIPSRQSARGIPSKQSARDIPLRQSTRDIPSKPSARDTSSRQSARDILSRQSTRDISPGESTRDTSSRKSARDIPSRQSDRDISSRVSASDSPSRQSARDTSSRKSARDILPGQFAKDTTSKQSIMDIPSRQSAMDISPGESARDTSSRKSAKDMQSRQSYKDSSLKKTVKDTPSRQSADGPQMMVTATESAQNPKSNKFSRSLTPSQSEIEDMPVQSAIYISSRQSSRKEAFDQSLRYSENQSLRDSENQSLRDSDDQSLTDSEVSQPSFRDISIHHLVHDARLSNNDRNTMLSKISMNEYKNDTSQNKPEIIPKQVSRIGTPRYEINSETARSARNTPLPDQAPSRASFHGNEDLEHQYRSVVMEGTDLSVYDEFGQKEIRNKDDEETLDKLEWELASESGRITADGKISRMDLPEDMSDDSVNSSQESFRSLSRLSQTDHGFDINSRLRKDELVDDENDENKSLDEEEVRALD